MRWLIFIILLLPSLTLAGTTTVTLGDTTYVRDASLNNNIGDSTNCGFNTASSGSALGLASVTDSTYKALIAPYRFDQAGLGEIYTAKLYFYVSGFHKGGHVRLKRLYHDWIEGDNNGSAVGNRHPSGGCTYTFYRTPTCTLNTSGLPSSFDWRDSSVVTKSKWQSGCGSCWSHSVTGALECALKRRDFPGGVGAGLNSQDSSGADVQGGPEYQASNAITKLINTTGAYTSIRLSKQSTNMTDTLSFLIRRYGDDDTGSFVLDKSKMQFAITYRDLDVDPVHCYYETLAVSDGIEATCISSDVPLLNMGGCARLHVNDDFPAILVRLPDVSSSLNADTIAVIVTLGIMIECDAEYTSLMVWPTTIAKNSHVGTYAVYKPWVWDAYDSTSSDSGACYTYWDRENYKNWGLAGVQQRNEYDLSEQQLIDCVGDGEGCAGGHISEGLSWAESTYVVDEETFPYYGDDNESCPGVTSSDSVIQLPFAHRINVDHTDSLKAALLARGPLLVTVSCTDDISYSQVDGDTCYSIANPSGDHAGVLIGWDNSKGCGDTTGAWLFKDSKGEAFANEGCAWISYKTITLGYAYALELSFDSVAYQWTDPGAACTDASCTGNNTSNTATCAAAACDHKQAFVDSLTISSTGWKYLDLDVDELNNMVAGESDLYGWVVAVESGDSTSMRVVGSESDPEFGDYRPYFLLEVESVGFFGKGILGKCVFGN